MSGFKLLLDSSRGQYIPRDFVKTFDLSKFSNIEPHDIKECQNPENDGYWDSWIAIIDNATFTEDGNVYQLHQDGDLWAYCASLMPDEEKLNFFEE